MQGCAVCGTPRSRSGRVEYFDEIETRKYRVEPHVPPFGQFARWESKKVLEVGCGIGTDTINFARAGAIVTAVELSSESLALASRCAEVFGLQGQIRFVCADPEYLSAAVEPELFDLVYSFGVIHHTPAPERAVPEIRRFMSPTAESPHDGLCEELLETVHDRCRHRSARGPVWLPGRLHYSHDEVLALLSGFEVVSIEQDHIFPFVVEKYIRHEYEVAPWFAAMPREMFRALERSLGWHTLVVARLKD